jgi:hypothetical protein
MCSRFVCLATPQATRRGSLTGEVVSLATPRSMTGTVWMTGVVPEGAPPALHRCVPASVPGVSGISHPQYHYPSSLHTTVLHTVTPPLAHSSPPARTLHAVSRSLSLPPTHDPSSSHTPQDCVTHSPIIPHHPTSVPYVCSWHTAGPQEAANRPGQCTGTAQGRPHRQPRVPQGWWEVRHGQPRHGVCSPQSPR